MVEVIVEICVKLFYVMGVMGVIVNDIDIVYCVFIRRFDGFYVKFIVCKFVWRFVREEVIKCCCDILKVSFVILGLRFEFKMDDIRIYEYLILNL